MGVVSDPAFSAGDIMRRMRELEKRVQQLAAARRLEASSIGAGGLTIRDGGNIDIVGGALRAFDNDGNLVVQAGLLPDNTRGLAAIDPATGELVSLSTLAFGTRTARVTASETTTSTTFTDLTTVGPTISNVLIGSSRRCVVLISCSVGATSDNVAVISCEVSGASSISAQDNVDASAFLSSAAATSMSGSATSVMLLDAAKGLQAGLNTFRLKYRAETTNSAPVFKDRKIVVIPY